MPLHLESIGDESNIDSFENRRFYVQMFEMKLLGYLLDEDDFEVIPTINRTLVTLELEQENILNDVIFEPLKRGHQVTYSFVWKPRGDNQFSFTAQYDASFTQLVDVENITRIVISVNNLVVFDGTILGAPLVLQANDVVNIRVYKNFLTIGKFKLIGSKTS